MKINIFFLIFFLILLCNSVWSQNYQNLIKINSDINSVFKGDGFVFESFGYERFINSRNSIGIWIGGNLKTSKLDINKESKTSSNANIVFTLDYYYYLYKSSNNGFYLSPAIYYMNAYVKNNEEHSHGYGLNIGLGYRYVFNRIALDALIYTTCGYIYTKNDTYIYRSREIEPINIKISAGYVF